MKQPTRKEKCDEKAGNIGRPFVWSEQLAPALKPDAVENTDFTPPEFDEPVAFEVLEMAADDFARAADFIGDVLMSRPYDLLVTPAVIEQGIDAVGANWRGFYGPKGMSDEAYDWWVAAIGQVYASDEWQGIMAQSGLAPLNLGGAEFEAFVAGSIEEIAEHSRGIGLIN